MLILKLRKKAQSWSVDVMVAFIIFIMGIFIFFIYATNYSGEAGENFELMSYEGNMILENLLSEGYPTNWDSGNVNVIGILTDNKMNDTKLERFNELVDTNYDNTKLLFNTRYNYYFNLSVPLEINGIGVDGIGDSGFSTSQNLIKVSRFSTYKNKPVSVYLYIWDG